MLKSYHTFHENQVFQTNKSFYPKSFSQKYSQIDHRYIYNLTPTERQIYYLLRRHYDYYSSFKLTNEYIANNIGCSIRTVMRATNKLHKDGLITKSRDHLYDCNKFMFQSEYVTPNKNLILREYISIKTITKTIPSLRARMREEDSLVFKSSNDYKKKRDSMNEFQRKWILHHKTDPRVKNMLNEPKIRAAILTPSIERLAQLLDLTEKEQLNLIAFSDRVLEDSYSQIEPVVNGTKKLKQPVADKMAWLVGIAKYYAKRNNETPDWLWYRDICDIVGIDSRNNERKPLKVKKEYSHKNTIPKQELSPEEQLRRWKKELQQREDRLSFYGTKPSVHDIKVIENLKAQITESQTNMPVVKKKRTWQDIQNILPFEDRRDAWMFEILKLTKQLENFPAHDPLNLKSLLMRTIENAKQELKDTEDKITRSSYAQEDILCEYESDSMDEDCDSQEYELQRSDTQQNIFWASSEPTA